MQFAGRRIIPTTLDPVPRSFRASPGVIAISNIEAEALRNGHGPTFKMLVEICSAEDMADALQTFKVKPRKVSPASPRIRPSARLAMLDAIGAGQRQKNAQRTA